MLTKEFAERNALHVNDRVNLGTVLGPRDFTVRGIMRSSGLSSAFGGNLAIMDIYAAQRMFGRGRTFDRIDLATTEEASIEEAQAELRDLLGPGFQVDVPAGRGQQFEAVTAAYGMMISISSLFALFIVEDRPGPAASPARPNSPPTTSTRGAAGAAAAAAAAGPPRG